MAVVRADPHRRLVICQHRTGVRADKARHRAVGPKLLAANPRAEQQTGCLLVGAGKQRRLLDERDDGVRHAFGLLSVGTAQQVVSAVDRQVCVVGARRAVIRSGQCIRATTQDSLVGGATHKEHGRH